MPRWIALLAAIAIACAPAATPTPTLNPGAASPPASGPPNASPAPTSGASDTPGPWLTMRWQRVEVTTATGPASLAGRGMASVGGGPRGGITLVIDEDGGAVSALVLQGQDWTLVPVVGLPADDSWPELAAGPSGYVAFMTKTTDGSGRTVHAWASPDGITWQRTGELTRMESVRAVAVGDDRIVACGAPGADASQSACEVSGDGGATWRRSTLPSGIREIGGVIAFGDEFLAAATDTAGRLRALTSGDGAAWTMSEPDPVLAAGDWSAALTQHDGVAILAGSAPPDRHTGAGGAALFSSRDGRTWQRVALPATEAAGFGLVDLGTAILAVGRVAADFQIRDVGLLTSSDGQGWRRDPELPWADDVDTAYGTASGMAVVRAAIGSDCATQEVRLYAGTPVVTADPGVAAEPVPTPAPDPVGAPAPPAFTAAGSVPGWMRSVTLGAEGLLAVGQDESGSGNVAWTSADGRTWAGGDEVVLGEHLSVDVVAGWSAGHVAAGVGCASKCDEMDWVAEARFWYRSASGEWLAAPRRTDHLLGRGYIEDAPDAGVRAVVETAAGLIAVVVAGTGGVVFRSTDGISWSRVATLDASPFAAVPWRGGVIVAGGNTYAANFWGAGAVWYSQDGVTWPDATMLESAPIDGLAASGDRVVAVAKGPAVLVSTDGRAWAWAPDQSTLTWGRMASVLGGRDGFLALGYDRCAAGSACLSAWRSTDGLAWSRSAIDWAGPADVRGPVAGFLLVAGSDQALALVPVTNPYPAGETTTMVMGVPWAP